MRPIRLPSGLLKLPSGLLKLPSGALGWIVLALAGTVGLFLVFWLFTTFWVLALGAGVVGSLALGWQRLQAHLQTKLWPKRWRRLPARRD